MKREELKHFTAQLVQGIAVIKECEVYDKSEADSVMDAMEARIKELEAQLENVQASTYAENVDANMALIKANERIKALEAEVKKWKQDNRYLSAFIHLLHKGEDANSTAIIDVANRFDKLEAKNARLKAQVPKWISVKDRLPKEDTWCTVFHEGEIDSDHYTRFTFNKKCDFTLYGNKVTHWMPLPPPPTEEYSETEKEGME